MVEGRQRSPLPARRDVGAAEIDNHVRAGKTRQQGAVADLPGSPLGRAVQDRVPVKANQLDRNIRIFRAKLRNCVGVQPGQLGLDRRHLADPAEDGAQLFTECLGIGHR